MKLLKTTIFILRAVTGFVLGWIFATFGEGVIGFFEPLLVFWFVFSFFFLCFWSISQYWSLMDIGLLGIVCAFCLWCFFYF